MSTAPAPKETLPFTEAQKQTVSGLTTMASLLTIALFVAGAVQIAGGPIAYFTQDVGLISALLTLVQGALTALLGLVMLAISNDLSFLVQFPRFSGNHLRNGAKNLTVYSQVLMGLAGLIALVVILRWVV